MVLLTVKQEDLFALLFGLDGPKDVRQGLSSSLFQ